MSTFDDFPGDMDPFPFDDRDGDALFGAAAGGSDVSASLRDAAALIRAARRSGSADELVGEDLVVADIAAAIGEPAARPRRGADERIPVLTKFRTAKLAAAATAVLMLGGTAAAAATGTLPSPVAIGSTAPAHHDAELASLHEASAPVVAQHHTDKPHHHGLFGTVASVNGVSDSGTCGTADTAGTFAITDRKGKTWTVNVDTTTAYTDKDVTDPSFANLCVDAFAKVTGTIDDSTSTVTATDVRIKTPKQRMGAFGKVESVNGDSTDGTCGTADTAGTFSLLDFKGDTFTVNVDPTTAFAEKGVTDASFMNVCVGLLAFAKGTVSGTTVTATDVFVLPPPPPPNPGHHHKQGVFGQVASVNGVSDPGTCGTDGATGSFTITDHDGNTITVDVSDSTQFFGKDDSSASFADVCVGQNVGAKGTETDSTVAADTVFVLGNRDFRFEGHGHHCDGMKGDDSHNAKVTSDRFGSNGNDNSGDNQGHGDHDGVGHHHDSSGRPGHDDN